MTVIDIVEELRFEDDLPRRAADEIERLRAVNLSLHRQILDMELTLIHEREARAEWIIKHG
jgi:hypothetical protein